MKIGWIVYGWDGCLLGFDKMASRSMNMTEFDEEVIQRAGDGRKLKRVVDSEMTVPLS